MENSSKKSGGVEIPKRKRSLDLKSLYKSEVSTVGESKKKVSKEADQVNIKKKKRSRKEVSLSCFESDAKKSRKENVDDVKSEQGFSQKSSGESKVLHGISPALDEIGNPFIFPRRPRDSVGRRRLVIDQVSKPLELRNSVDCVGAFNGKVIKPKDEDGTSDQLVRLVTLPAGNDVASNSKSAGKVGGSNSKSMGKVRGSNSKSAGKVGGSNPKFKGKIGGSNSKSVGKLGGSNSKSMGKVSDSNSNSVRKVGGSNSKSAGEVGDSNSKSAGDVGGSNSKSMGKVGGSNSTFMGKIGLNSKSAGGVGGSNPKSAGEAGGSNAKSAGEVRGLNSKSAVKVAGSNSKSNGKVGSSNSKTKHKADSKSTGKGSSSNVKLKRKAGADELKESGNSRSCSVQHSEKEDSLVVNNGDMSYKKRRSNSRTKTDLVVGRDGGEASKKKSEPSVGSTASDSQFVDSDDEENLEQNAARMLSSRFDPSCTGFSSKRKPSVSQTADGFSFRVSSSKDLFSRQANSSSAVDSAPADDKNKAPRPRREDKGKSVPRKRRHFYEILPRDLDPHWVLNQRIKVFWPLDESWYYGLVSDYHPECKLHHIKYDDRDEEWIDLQEEKFKLLLFPSEVPGKAKSKKVSPGDNNVCKEEPVTAKDDDSCMGNYLDSEPIALWLARSSQRGKSLKTQRASHMELPMVSSLFSEKTDNLNSNVADSKRTRSNPDYESISADNLLVHGVVYKPAVGSINGSHVVYVRKKNHKKSVGSGSSPGTVIPLSPVIVNLPSAKEDKLYYGFVDSDKQLWSIDHQGMLRLNVEIVESKEFRFQICLSVLPSWGFSFGTGDSWLLHHIFMLQHGMMVAASPPVILEMLFIDSYLGLRFLLFEGCMKKALVFVFLILTVFCRPDEHMNGNIQSPVTSIRFRLSSVQDLRKKHVFEFHSFSRLQSSKWDWLDSKLLQHFLLIKQLPVSEITYDNLKELEYGSLKQCNPHVGLELSSYVGFNKNFLLGILPRGVSKEACNTRISQSALSLAANSGKVPQFALSFSAAPTFFLTLHLQLLMENSFDCGNLHHHDALSSAESSENISRPDADCTQFETSLVAEDQIGTLETETPPFRGLASSNEDLAADVALVSSAQSVVRFPSVPISGPSPTSNPKSDSRFGGITVDIPSCDQVDTPPDGKGCISGQASDVGCNVNEGFVNSPNLTGSRSSWQDGRSSSISSPLGDLSPLWSDGSSKFMLSGFSNGPKKPRTQVQYTLPAAGYDFSGKQKMQNQRAVPCKRIRRASLKRISDGSRSNQKKFELLACSANVLVTHGDKGWRECGALIVLEAADHNEWKLAIKQFGITKYSYKVKHMLQPGSTNRYSHAILWKGGKDWVLEFPDKRQWMLFKELHEECYNRNIRAASVKNIPIPGVRLIEESDDYGTEVPFVQSSTKYFQQVQTDVEMAMDPSHILYDMDSDDEQWLMAKKKCTDGNRCEEISEEFLEKTMDMFEKVSYVQRRKNFTDAEIQELVIGMGSAEAAKLVYEHWQEKRGRKGMPLIRHLQPPLWERYEQQLKQWGHTVARGKSVSVGTQEKAPIPEKPPMFAFCLKPRGLDIPPNKSSKQRSHRKFSVSGHLHASSGDRDSLVVLGRRSNRHTFGDAQSSMSTDVSELSRNPKAYKNKRRKFGSHPSSSNQQATTNNQSTRGSRNEVQQLNMGLPDLSSRQGREQLNVSYFHEIQVRNAQAAAERANNNAKRKRENASRAFNMADLAIHKAVGALMIAEAAARAAAENSNGGN